MIQYRDKHRQTYVFNIAVEQGVRQRSSIFPDLQFRFPVQKKDAKATLKAEAPIAPTPEDSYDGNRGKHLEFVISADSVGARLRG